MADTETQKKKVLFVLPALVAGGAERVLITLMNNLDRNHYEPSMLTISRKGTLRNLIRDEIPFHCLEKDGIPAAMPQLFTYLRKEKPDIVISTMTHMNFAVLCLRPFFRKTAFVIREAITPGYLLKKKRKLSWLLRGTYMLLYPNADLVLAPSKSVADEFEKKLKIWLPQLKILYNPVDVRSVRGDETVKPSQINDREKTISFVSAGRLDAQKGYDRLIRALAKLGADFRWHWTILGQGPQRKTLETLIDESGLSDRIALPGLSKQPWPRIAEADALLLPSRYEGMPNVVLESLACGTPVIASAEAGGVNEIAEAVSGDSILLAENMKDFVKAMRNVKPAPTQTYRDILLPDIFYLETIMTRFNRLLAEYAQR